MKKLNITSAGSRQFYPSELCISCPTRDVALFADVKAEDLHNMDAPIHYEVIDKGSQLYGIDDKADDLYTLHEGVLKLSQQLPTGEQRIVRLLHRGDLAGIEAVTSDYYQHDATALTRVSLCRIPADVIRDYSRKSPELHNSLMNKWQSALSASDTWLTRLSTGPSRYRVVRLLIWLAEAENEEGFTLPGRKDIGNILALTTETVSRLIAELKREGLLVQSGMQAARVDLDALKIIVKEGECD